MSSHHFVKEGQEPPLVILSWSEKLREIAFELLAWQPQLVVDAKFLDHILADDIKPDVVLDLDYPIPDFLQPLKAETKNVFFKQQNEMTIIYDTADYEEIKNIISNKFTVLYTEKYKIYFLKHRFEKIMPQGKNSYFLNEQNELKPLENQLDVLVFEEL
jgi:hypothetical protein